MVPFSAEGANVPIFLAVQPRTNPSVSYSNASHFDYFGISGTGASGNPSALQSNGWGGGNSMELGVTSTGMTIARAYLFEPNNPKSLSIQMKNAFDNHKSLFSEKQLSEHLQKFDHHKVCKSVEKELSLNI